MNLNKRILVVLNPGAERQPALERAAQIAAASEAELRLQAVVYQPEYSKGVFHWDDDERAAQRKARIKEAADWLQERASKLDHGRVTVRANWGHPFDEIVLSVIEGYRPDVLMLQPRDGAGGGLTLTEWRLLRQCPVPVWLVRAENWPKQPAVLAAVDPTHDDDKPASLDRDILAAADSVAGLFKTGFRVLHALGEIPSAIGIAQSPKDYERELREIRAKRIRELMPADGAQRAEIELSPHDPAKALRHHCRERGADLVVMGMLARSRLSDLLVGSTAREFIPKSACDVVLIKPPLD